MMACSQIDGWSHRTAYNGLEDITDAYGAIDADILLYRSMTYAEQEINWFDNVWTLYADIDEAKKDIQLPA